ncbi:MAG TPA: type 4a pilus biogenesis protein PilO [Vicinamibacteria bacterium]|nr:type 4a pilus biogenesis protein PilO [Vicinamibacteria bacterium]
MILALVFLLGVAQPPRPFADERRLLDGRLETLRRILPDGPNPASDLAVVKELARPLALTGLEVTPRAALETGHRGDVPVEVVGVGRFEEIDRFFRQVALSHRLMDVESLTLIAEREERVRFAALLRLPYRPLRAPLPAPPEGSRPLGASRAELESFNHDLALALAKSETIAQLRRARRNPRVFFSELSSIVRERPVVIQRASLAEDFSIAGLTVGEASLRALESRLERGFFRIAEVLVVRQGACHRFEARGKSPVVGIEAEIPLPSEDPFRQDEASCRVDRDPTGRGLKARGPSGRTPSKGPLTLRLRELDAADVFQVLELLTGQGFLVDEEVTGRVSLEMSRLELREVLALLEKQLGVRISETGAVRRVWRRPSPPPSSPATGGEGPRASFAVKRAPLGELLAVLKEADPGFGFEGSPAGRASLWARNLTVADLKSAVLTASGLSELRVEPPPGNDADREPAPGRKLVLRPQDLAVGEFALAGLVHGESGWLALAYSPTGTLYAYRAGDRLGDGMLASVESTDVQLETEDGPLRILLPEMGR